MKKNGSFKNIRVRKFLTVCLFCLISFSAFAQTEAVTDSSEGDPSDVKNLVIIAAPENPKLSKKEQKKLEKEAKKKAKEEKKAGKKAAAEQPAEETANYTGWIQGSRKNLKEVYGNIQLSVKARLGSFSLAVLNEAEKAVPILSVSNEYTTNGFYLRVGKKVYSLVAGGAIQTSVSKNTTGAAIKYEIPEVADVIVNFNFYPFNDRNANNIVKITATVTNKGPRSDEFCVKTILDTILGESSSYHFYTADGVAIKKEVSYRTLQNQKYFLSSNDYASMQLFFTGAECVEPEFLAFANYSTLDKNVWEPSMSVLRDFDTVFSYNNSAVCAIWKPVRLDKGESAQLSFYLAAAADGKKPGAEKFFKKQDKTPAPKSAEEELVKDLLQNDSAPVETQTIPADTEPEPKPAVQELQSPVEAAESAAKEVPTVDFYIKNMTKEQLTQEYIQALLDRISALEEDSPSLNRQELLQLNAELDAILTYLRQ